MRSKSANRTTTYRSTFLVSGAAATPTFRGGRLKYTAQNILLIIHMHFVADADTHYCVVLVAG